MTTDFTATQKRALAIATVLALGFGPYFLRGYFILVVVAAVSTYLFNPLFDRFQKRFGRGISVALTLLSALGVVIIRSACWCCWRSSRSRRWSAASPPGCRKPV